MRRLAWFVPPALLLTAASVAIATGPDRIEVSGPLRTNGGIAWKHEVGRQPSRMCSPRYRRVVGEPCEMTVVYLQNLTNAPIQCVVTIDRDEPDTFGLRSVSTKLILPNLGGGANGWVLASTGVPVNGDEAVTSFCETAIF